MKSKRLTSLPEPMASVLDAEISDARVERILEGWPKRRRGRMRGQAAASALGGRLAFAAAPVLLAVPLLFIALTWSLRTTPPQETRSVAKVGPSGTAPEASLETSIEEGSLHIDTPGLPPVLAAPEDRGHHFTLSDNSVIILDAGTRLEVEESLPNQLVLRLVLGQAHFDVRHRPGRAWIVQADRHQVEVVGTRFSVGLKGGVTRVDVHEGKVRVVGPHVRRLLHANETWRSEAEAKRKRSRRARIAKRTASSRSPRDRAPKPRPSSELEVRAPDAGLPASPSWKDLASAGEYAAALEALRLAGGWAPLETSELDTLLLASDVARATGHIEPALVLLGRRAPQLTEAASAQVVALVRVDLLLGPAHRPAEAASVIEEVLLRFSAGPSDELLRLRLVKAYLEAGEREAAERAASIYLQRYPKGSGRAMVEAWLR